MSNANDQASSSFDSYVNEAEKSAEVQEKIQKAAEYLEKKLNKKIEENKPQKIRLIRTGRSNLQKYGDVMLSLGESLLTWADDVQRESKSNSILRRKEYELEYNTKSKALDEQAIADSGIENVEEAWKEIQARKQRDLEMFAD